MMRSSTYNRFGVLMGTSARASSSRWLSLREGSLPMITLISLQGDFCATARRRFGRQCRGQGKVLLRLVRETEARRLALGAPVVALAQAAHVQLPSVQPLGEPKRQRVATQLREALSAHDHIATQSRRLIHGKRLGHCKIVHAYDKTIAPKIG